MHALPQAVRAIGRCAVILERAAEKCINVLLELIQTKVNYVVQEAIIVIKVCTHFTYVAVVQQAVEGRFVGLQVCDEENT